MDKIPFFATATLLFLVITLGQKSANACVNSLDEMVSDSGCQTSECSTSCSTVTTPPGDGRTINRCLLIFGSESEGHDRFATEFLPIRPMISASLGSTDFWLPETEGSRRLLAANALSSNLAARQGGTGGTNQ